MNQSKNTNRKKNQFYMVLILMTIGAMLLAACSSSTPAPAETQPAQEQPQTTQAPVPAETQPAGEPTVESQSGAAATAIMDKDWVLIAYGDPENPTVVEPGTYTTIHFNSADGQVNGTGGCNTFNSTYTADEKGALTINSPISSTTAACEKGMEQESAYFQALEKANGYEINPQGKLLINYLGEGDAQRQLIFMAETPFVGTVWVLSSYGDPNNLAYPEQGVLSTAVFNADGSLNGSGGCNNYNATYTVDGSQISISQPASTRMACEKGQDQENAFLAGLQNAESYQVMNGTLKITSSGGATVLYFNGRRQPLENVRWKLAFVDGQPVDPNITATALFIPSTSAASTNPENSVSGNAGCNDYSGPYTVEGNALTAGPFTATEMACDEATNQVEQAFLSGLQNAQSYETLQNQLTITTATGSLIFYADKTRLEGVNWKLISLGPIDSPRPPAEGTNFTALFERQFGMTSGIMKGETGCNEYTLTYYAGQHDFKANLPQTTQKTCNDAITEEEQAYFLGLDSAKEYRIIGTELQIFYDDSILVFQPYDPQAPTGETLMPLNGTTWFLTWFNGDTPVINGTQISISFAINEDGTTGQINGSAGCNTYSGEIAGIFTLKNLSSGRKTCDDPPGVMEQEAKYLSELSSAERIFVKDNTLKIKTANGVLIYEGGASIPVQPTPTAPASTEPVPTEPVETEPPEEIQAFITGPLEGQVGNKLVYIATTSGSDIPIKSYVWDFGDDTTGEGEQVEHIFDAPGTYYILLVVTNENGAIGKAGIDVKITEK